MRPAFSGYTIAHGAKHVLDRAFPSYLTTFDGNWFHGDKNGTSYLYVHEGPCNLAIDGNLPFRLVAGMFAVVPGEFSVIGGRGIIVTREQYRGLFQIGGPVEREGRLKYIDGCTDTLLTAPVRKGDPCLNLLYFPSGIDQTEHTHPSDRIGIVMSGRGRCVHREAAGAEPVHVDLVAGMVFCIHTDGLHKFQTPYGEEMRVLAYHPDSDFGPTDEEHPMLNRTIVEGVSAKHLDAIRTR